MMKDQSSEALPIFAYEINKNCHKIYQPLAEKRFRFRWIGSKPENHLFGLEQLPFSGDLLFLAAGEKDCLTLAAQGFSAFTLNSETATLPKEMAVSLKARFKNILVAYDLDETGIRSSQKLADTHGFAQLRLSAEMTELGVGKDVSDFFKATLTSEVGASLQQGQIPKVDFGSHVVTHAGNNDVSGAQNCTHNDRKAERGKVKTHRASEAYSYSTPKSDPFP
ncbi:MAG: toprim domain-containing protein [Bacteroidetes bacterium]|nr:toprim domain-containing protein [Bacteroidota bacterium]